MERNSFRLFLDSRELSARQFRLMTLIARPQKIAGGSLLGRQGQGSGGEIGVEGKVLILGDRYKPSTAPRLGPVVS